MQIQSCWLTVMRILLYPGWVWYLWWKRWKWCLPSAGCVWEFPVPTRPAQRPRGLGWEGALCGPPYLFPAGECKPRLLNGLWWLGERGLTDSEWEQSPAPHRNFWQCPSREERRVLLQPQLCHGTWLQWASYCLRVFCHMGLPSSSSFG